MVKQSLGSAIFVNEVDADRKAFERPTRLLDELAVAGQVRKGEGDL